MQLCIFSPDGTLVRTDIIDPKSVFIANFLKILEVAEGGILWLKAAWHDRPMILVKRLRGWRSMLTTDSRWRALHKRKLDG